MCVATDGQCLDIDGQGDLSFWTVADNIKTGAAYNAVLLVEKLLKDYL